MSEISQINFRLLADLRGDFDNAGRLRHINGRVTQYLVRYSEMDR